MQARLDAFRHGLHGLGWMEGRNLHIDYRFADGRRDLIIALASRYRLPAVYSLRSFVEDGGLMSYGADQADMFRQAAGYVDRILRGADPAVQVPVKYETILNLKTAKALDLAVPPGLLVAADKVIE
jgi:putative ABC transport system substrate-binding protein